MAGDILSREFRNAIERSSVEGFRRDCKSRLLACP